MVDPLKLAENVLKTVAACWQQQAADTATSSTCSAGLAEQPADRAVADAPAGVQDQIEQQRSEFSPAATIPSRAGIAEYERLSLERKFAAKSFVSALTLLQLARSTCCASRITWIRSWCRAWPTSRPRRIAWRGPRPYSLRAGAVLGVPPARLRRRGGKTLSSA